MSKELYFDMAATTPLLHEVKQALVEAFDTYGNPSSLHSKGMQAQKRVELARKQVLRALGSTSGQLVFTGCGTEANNLALFGVTGKYANKARHIVTTQIEHPSVLETSRALQRQGWRVTYIAPEPDGSVQADKILAAVTDDTVLVSMMHVNNETGAVLPIAEVGTALSRNPRVLFHVDGIQAFGKIPMPAQWADLYSISGHKIGAPKGIGALYLKKNLTLDPILFGGGQEAGFRAGTENVLGIIALGVAAQLAHQNASVAMAKATSLSEDLLAGLANIAGCQIGRAPEASPYIISAAFPGLKAEVLVHAFASQGLFVSTGSACSSKKRFAKGSHVLEAMRRPSAEINGTIRFSLDSSYTAADIQEVLRIVQQQTAWVRAMV